MSERAKVGLVLGLFAIVGVVSFFLFRAEYSHGKRLRVVEPGRFYRCGQLTAAGFEDAIREYGIKTIINLQEDVPDPNIWNNYYDRRTSKESDLCKRLGVRYVWLAPDLVLPHETNKPHPTVIDQFREVMDQEWNYPVLIHCKAGLHRTGLIAAIYRMEYNGWSRVAAYREMRAHGFGDWASTRSNIYVDQYLLRFTPRTRTKTVAAELSN
jgi:protein tyrosine phosphatase (PTP) superfamily phosphohydrolase (DUF442 family)